MEKTYQNIELEGVKCGYPGSENSKFWNEGKWENFIAPLLPADCEDMTFVEIGCNAGLFLKLATEGGFRDVVGFERRKTNCRNARKYRDSLGYGYRIIHRTVGVDFDFSEMPVADVTLLSTVHYYFDISQWVELLDQLRYKTRLCIVVSRHGDKDNHWKASGQLADVRHYFRDWEEIGGVDDISQEEDPRPRPLWSMLFGSGLKTLELDKIYSINERIGGEVDYAIKRDLMEDIKRNGLKKPLLVKPSGQLLDGRHRLNIRKELGYKRVIARIV